MVALVTLAYTVGLPESKGALQATPLHQRHHILDFTACLGRRRMIPARARRAWPMESE